MKGEKCMSAFRTASVFSDRMVLQRNKNINVFGTGAENEIIEIEFDGNTAKSIVKNFLRTDNF